MTSQDMMKKRSQHMMKKRSRVKNKTFFDFKYFSIFRRKKGLNRSTFSFSMTKKRKQLCRERKEVRCRDKKDEKKENHYDGAEHKVLLGVVKRV